VGHQDYFLAPLPGSEALLKSGIGKGNRRCEYCFYFCLLFLFQVLPGSNGELRETIWWTQWKLVVPLAAPVMGSHNSGSMAMGSASSGSVA
jgi:hypothetical protein